MSTTDRTKTILVVEDDTSISDLISWILTDAGFEVYTAATVADALEQYGAVHPDLIVADLVLPDGLGSDLVAKLRRDHESASSPTLLVSAHPQARSQAKQAGVDACLPKPFDLEEFYETVFELAGSGPSTPDDERLSAD